MTQLMTTRQQKWDFSNYYIQRILETLIVKYKSYTLFLLFLVFCLFCFLLCHQAAQQSLFYTEKCQWISGLVFPPEVQVEPHKKQLHVTLAYNFPSDRLSSLEKLAKGIEVKLGCDWLAVLFSRDIRFANHEVTIAHASFTITHSGFSLPVYTGRLQMKLNPLPLLPLIWQLNKYCFTIDSSRLTIKKDVFLLALLCLCCFSQQKVAIKKLCCDA